jgi:hypothetical protein
MEKIIAAVRIRPIKEQDPEKIAIKQSGDRGILALKHKDKFSYEQVYSAKASNMDLFEGSVVPLLERAVKGYNGIFPL